MPSSGGPRAIRFSSKELLTAFAETGAVADELPDSVQAILSARVDRLASADKAALQAASVIGRIFWSGPTRELTRAADADWAALEDRDFVRRRPGSSLAGEAEYTFKHALTREVVYASVPRARRARLHADFAAWLERTGGGRDEDAALLAHHYTQAASPADADLAWPDAEDELELVRARAVGWLRRAAELAVSRYDLDEGLADLHRALELCQPAEQLGLWREIGRASALKFDGEQFWVSMKRAIELTDDAQMRAELLGDLAFQTSVRSGMWPQRPEHEEVEGCERGPEVERTVTENLGTPCIRNARSLLVEAVAHAYGGEHVEARRFEERALELAAEGFGFRLFGPRVRLALLRNELGAVEAMLDEDVPRRGHDWMVTSAMVTTRLDALVALGRHAEETRRLVLQA